MNPLLPLLLGHAADGLWRCPPLGDEPAELIASFDRKAIVVEVGRDKPALLDGFAVAGRFPAWVGHNWDALEDALRDLSWLGPGGVVVVLQPAATANDEAIWTVLVEVADSAARFWADHRRSFSVVITAAPGPLPKAVAALPDLAELG